MQIDFLCGNIIDYICFKNIYELMPEIRITARNRSIKKQLQKYGIDAPIYPTFPDVIIMARHLTRKYPVKNMRKIGMTHGAYNFKKLISAKEDNAFDKYIFTSSHKEKEARELGVKCGTAVGYPKIDKAFSGEEFNLDIYKRKLRLDPQKNTIIFSATWDKKGYAAIDKWYDQLDKLVDDYNVLVTVHPWTSPTKIGVIKKTKGVKYIEDKDILPYLMIADLMIGDTSSILGEFCALDKPLITFEIALVGRMTTETKNMLEEISFRVNNFTELINIIPVALSKKDFHAQARAKYNKIMFDSLDGKASERAVKIIKEVIGDYK
jgi:hypothetical protein